MIQKSLDEITEDVLLGLIRDEVAEGRTIDYKRELPGTSDNDRKEFLADVSSFANTSGGDLVFGVDEAQGLPVEITGLKISDLDMETRRLESIVGSGLDPRIRYAVKIVTCANGPKVLIFRVERSWSGPHRVVFKGHDKFYGRNSAGKYPLDVDELRTAFTLASTVTERIRAFRADRTINLSNNQTPVPFKPGPKLVLHFIPIEAFAGKTSYDVLPYYTQPARLRPMAASSWERRLNLEGLVAFASINPSYSYTQIYRTGVIEVVQGSLLSRQHQGRLIIPSIAYEKEVLDYLPSCLTVLKDLGVNPPVVLALTLTNTRGLIMAVDSYGMEFGYPIEADTLILPEAMVEDFSTPPGRILKPLFDLVWNASGFPSSKNFDPDGNWINRH